MKKINMIRKRPIKITFFSERLSKVYVEDVKTCLTHLNQIPINVKVWFYKDHQDQDRILIAQWTKPNHKLPRSKTLQQTDFGYICPNCNTNEFLKYRTSLMTISNRDKARFNRADFGMYCTVCEAVHFGVTQPTK